MTSPWILSKYVTMEKKEYKMEARITEWWLFHSCCCYLVHGAKLWKIYTSTELKVINVETEVQGGTSLSKNASFKIQSTARLLDLLVFSLCAAFAVFTNAL